MRRMFSKPQLLEAVEQEAEVNGLKAFENIVDKDGHARFIEGDITIETISGLTQTYGKWALSGSHLLIVVCYAIANGTNTGFISTLCSINIPQWIKNKIVATGGSFVASHNELAISSDDSTQSFATYLRKSGDNLFISHASLSVSADKNVRIAYDLLIDNE